MTEFPSFEEWSKTHEGTKADYIRARKQFYLQKSKEEFKKSIKRSKTEKKREKTPEWLGVGFNFWKDEEEKPKDDRDEASKELERQIREESKQ